MALVRILCESIPISLADRFRVAACSTTLWQGLQTNAKRLEGILELLFLSFLLLGKKNFLHQPSHGLGHHECLWSRVWIGSWGANSMQFHKNRNKIATKLLCGPFSARASRILDRSVAIELRTFYHTWSVCHVHLAPGSKLPLYPFPPMDYVLLRDSTMKNRKIRAALDAQMDLTHSLIFTCALACSIFENSFVVTGWLTCAEKASFTWFGYSKILANIQYGVTVMGLIDAFVHAHYQHRRNIKNPGDTGDCMERRIRFMTALTLAYAHTYKVTWLLTRHRLAIARHNFRLPT